MADLIDRQAAIDAIQKLNIPEDMCMFEIMSHIEVEIATLPSAQPKRGKWILNRSGAYCCSECMEPCASYFMMKPRDKFCKMCGAKMER